MNKKYFAVIIMLIVAGVAGFFVWSDWTDLRNKKDMIIDSENFIGQTLSTKEVRDMIPSRPLDESQTQGWNRYTSQKLGISFKYPPNYLVVEAENPTTPSIGESVSISIMENTPRNRSIAKMMNSDFDIPESPSNADIELKPSIGLSKSIAGGFTQDIMRWFGEGGIQIGDRFVYGPANFIGIDSVLYQGEGLDIFDGVIFEREGYLYQFSVPHYYPPESGMTDFYKIISTVEFK